jgi:hypothetical protein
LSARGFVGTRITWWPRHLKYAPGVAESSDLDRLEQDLDDLEVALACLSRDGDDRCPTCRSALAEGNLAERPALAACAATKLPAEVELPI